MKQGEIKKTVRKRYADIAKGESSCCRPTSSCCGNLNVVEDISKSIGYTDEEIKMVPEGANLGLGCGNPVAIATLKAGETILDLGSGAGFDCFLAANAVGKDGKVIGVDMTPEMIDKARENARKGNYKNVEFRLGEIENIPAADSSVDCVISNCVINLAPEKGRVFKETFRVLKPGGRLMVSDIVVTKELPEFIRNSLAAYVGCIAGALMKEEYLQTIRDAGFKEVRVIDEQLFPIDAIANDPTAQAIIDKRHVSQEGLEEIGNSVLSIKVEGKKSG
ncbi:MAG: arsenite methyltransferase [Deltaproteobacteria bacterium]|nr:arsenite methyltransferase [Deltaproteobacteria bacterium]